jgi:hypothetical protein
MALQLTDILWTNVTGAGVITNGASLLGFTLPPGVVGGLIAITFWYANYMALEWLLRDKQINWSQRKEMVVALALILYTLGDAVADMMSGIFMSYDNVTIHTLGDHLANLNVGVAFLMLFLAGSSLLADILNIGIMTGMLDVEETKTPKRTLSRAEVKRAEYLRKRHYGREKNATQEPN